MEKIQNFILDFVKFSLQTIKSNNFRHLIYKFLIDTIFKKFYFEYDDFKT